MRKYVKKEILSIINLLENAVVTIKQISDKGNATALRMFLEECQNTAIKVGTEIENSEGEGTKAVSLLENLCELIYQCSIASGRPVVYRLCKEMKQTLCEIRESIKNDIPERRMKIVFMPYKAAMWDSLESVWEAANEDEECDAYVLPVPYFDKEPDGSFGTLHDEKNDFPDYVPVIDWQSYDLEQEHPDIIFFHNPYDEYNKVTSVHPRFYSGELKKYTDRLVYIPYFVCYADVKRHYCTTPGVYNADRVIVQSDKICDTYKRVFVESLLDMQEGMSIVEKMQYKQELETIAEEKFLGLGSPKLDKVMKYDDKSYEIPETWHELIGEGIFKKKVILLNLHISTIMKGREAVFFDDIERVFDIFRNNRDVVLLWRPHPLMEATINAMNPHIRDRYKKIVAQYCKEGWGIYDDTPNFDRAVKVADAYYGDKSSVVELFKAAGKPVMIMKHTTNA